MVIIETINFKLPELNLHIFFVSYDNNWQSGDE